MTRPHQEGPSILWGRLHPSLLDHPLRLGLLLRPLPLPLQQAQVAQILLAPHLHRLSPEALEAQSLPLRQSLRGLLLPRWLLLHPWLQQTLVAQFLPAHRPPHLNLEGQ